MRSPRHSQATVRRRTLPPLLRRFGGWMAGKPWRSLGAFDLSTEWSDSHFPYAEFLYDQFALFIRLPDGSSVGYWLADRPLAEAPIIILGSEGAFAALAPSLEALLARIALGDFSNNGPASDFLYSGFDTGEGVPPDLRGAMQSFLRAETGVQDLHALARSPVSKPGEFTGWVFATAGALSKRVQAHPAILALARLLEKYRPTSGDPWASTLIDIRWAGATFDAWVASSMATLPEADGIKPHLATLRDEWAASKPGLGLWNRATLMVTKDQVTFLPDYIYAPDFRTDQPSAEAFKADQARTPRAARRIPAWLVTILAS